MYSNSHFPFPNLIMLGKRKYEEQFRIFLGERPTECQRISQKYSKLQIAPVLINEIMLLPYSGSLVDICRFNRDIEYGNAVFILNRCTGYNLAI